MGRMIIVSNRLPVSVDEENGKFIFKPLGGEFPTGLSTFLGDKENLWFGFPGKIVSEAEERADLIIALSEHSMVPVYLNQQEASEFYDGFCNETIWPAFHYFSQFITIQDHLWETYVRVNERYCDAIVRKYKSGDTIWIHDYHLLLLPKMIRDRIPEATIGFFNHVPFPSFEIFRMLPWRSELLEGICGADQVGFNTYDDMRHFLSSTRRILGYSHEAGFLHTPNHLVNVDAFPLGIDYAKFHRIAKSPEIEKMLGEIKDELGHQKLVLTCDRLDYSKGLPQRLRAFDLLIDNHPEYLEKVSMIMIVMPSRTSIPEYNELKETIDTLVGRINSKYSTLDWVPIHYFYRKLDFEELVAFYRISTVALITPLRDGMNLVCKEYIASRVHQDGALILSEMAGASKELQEALTVNPNNIRMMEQALFQALNLSPEEQKRRMGNLQRTVAKYDIYHWMKVYLSSLDRIKAKQEKLRTNIIGQQEVEHLKRRFEEAKNPLIFLDYDGALVDYKNQPEEAFPDPQVLGILEQIGNLASVVIISGRDKSTLHNWLDNRPIHLIAEHGVYWKMKGEKQWETKVQLCNDWKNAFRKEMDEFVERTPGTFVEEKDHSLVWHYRKVQSGLGNLRKRELFSHLKYVARGHHLQVLEGNRALEIKKPDVSKSKATFEFLKTQDYDFVLVIGDNWTDEQTFKDLSPTAITIRVGYAYSRAEYNLKNHEQVRRFLMELCLKESPENQAVDHTE